MGFSFGLFLLAQERKNRVWRAKVKEKKKRKGSWGDLVLGWAMRADFY